MRSIYSNKKPDTFSITDCTLCEHLDISVKVNHIEGYYIEYDRYGVVSIRAVCKECRELDTVK